MTVENFLNMSIYFVFFRKQSVEFFVAANRAQRSLSKLACGIEIIFDRDDRLDRIDYPEINYGAHLNRNIITRNDVLCRHLLDDDAKTDLLKPVEHRDKEDNPRPFCTNNPPEAEDHTPFVFV